MTEEASRPGTSAPAGRELRVAIALAAVQAAALVVLALVLVVQTIVGDPSSIGGALISAVMVLITAGAVALCARGLHLGRRAAVSPLVVGELIAVAVGYTVGISAGRLGYGLPVLLSAVAVLVLLFTPGARRAWEGGS